MPPDSPRPTDLAAQTDRPDLPDLPDLVNLRDVGGLRTDGGARTRYGVLLRCATPAFLDRDQALALVGEWGVRTRLDLRAPHEVAEETSADLLDVERETGVTLRHLEVHSGGLAWDWAGDDTHATRAERVAGHYLAYLRSSPDSVVAVARALVEDDGPALVHCSAGKDRTGTVVAVVLAAAGVTRDDVVADYGASSAASEAIRAQARRMPAFQERLAHLPAEAYDSLPATMGIVLDRLEEEYGGAAGYLTAHGLSAAELRRLRERLIDDAT